jgi:hypothetical protein
MEIEMVYSKPLEIPMEIEPVGFSYYYNTNHNQELNAITLDPIQQGTAQPLG